MFKRSLCVILVFSLMILSCVSLASCGEAANNTNALNKYSDYALDYFDTVTSIIGYARTEEEFKAVSTEIISELGEYHRLFDIYKRYEGLENLCTINELKDGEHRVVTVDRRIIDMLKYAKEMYFKTDGMVNIAMGSVLSIWHDYREHGANNPWEAELPPMDKLLEASEHTNINDLVIDEENCTVTITDPKMKLDVGAIAKGYAVEMLARGLEEKGITGYIINVGGNVRTVGLKGDGSKWLVVIDNPEDDPDNPYLAYLNLAGEALVTSGSYQRYYVVDGKRYHHIIDPETLMPGEDYTSVSIICESSAAGDAFSTALFCMDAERGLALVEATEGIEAMWVLTDGTTITSSGFASYKK